MKKIFSIIPLLFIIQLVMAQERYVTGIVTSSDDGLPLMGVAVLDRQTMNGVTTNLDGEFSIQVSSRTKTLQFSYLGYKTIEIEPTTERLTISLDPDLVAIDEVMVIAYGTGKKSTFTGSASVVKKESLEKIKTSNVTQALQGQSSGIQVINSSGEPGQDAKINIRGIGSINASSNPLYVVDGIAYDGAINAISSSDIESITVLKDASATSLYGSRAANGVIVITTKKGTSEKAQINFRTSWGFSKLAVGLPRRLTPEEYLTFFWTSYYNGNVDNYNPEWNPEKPDVTTMRQMGSILQNYNPYNINMPLNNEGKLLPEAQLLYVGDWDKELMQSGLRQEYNIDFSGKTKSGDYFISGSYVDDEGIYTTQHFQRFSTRTNLNYSIKKWLDVGTNINLSHSKTEGGMAGNPTWFLRTIPSIYPVYEFDRTTGTYNTDKNGNKIYDYGNYRPAWTGWNPLGDKEYNSYPTMYDNVSTRTYIELKILPELKFRTNLSIDYYLMSYDGYVNSQYGYAAGYGGEVEKQKRRSFSYTINNLLTYAKTFGDHTVNVLLGQEAYSLETKYLSAIKRGLPFLGLEEIGAAANMSSMDSYTDIYRLLSWFSRIEYDYKDKYYISGSFRTDGSSRFHPNNRWGKFWSIGASWRTSNESFMEDVSWIDNLKLRTSYGAVGNDKLESNGSPMYYAYQGLYRAGYNDYTNAGVLIGSLANPNLKWESNIQFNVGIDFAFCNKLSGSIEWFNRKSKDLLFPMPMAPSTGFDNINRNIGDIKNEGLEFQLNFVAIHNKDFNWTIDLNGTTYKNKITKLPQGEMNAGTFKWREGESRYNFWGVEYAGVNPKTGNDQYWKNIYETINGEKIVTDRILTEDYHELSSDDQKKYLGDAIPKLFGGLTNNFYYKGIDLSFMFYYSIGGKLYDQDYSEMMYPRLGYSPHPDMLKGWTPENTNAKFPRVTSSKANTMGSYSSKYVFDNSFLRLRNLTLGYTLLKTFTNRFDINSLRFYIQGDNVFTLGNAAKRGTDPEQDISGRTANRFPTTKSISFGLQLTL